METGLRRIYVAALAVLLAAPAFARGDDPLEGLVSPDLERREIREAAIDTEDFEFSTFGGVMNVEDFGSNVVFGGALAYHISEDLFMEVGFGQTELAESSFERLSGSAPLLTDEQREMQFYNLSLAWNLFPGEYFLFDRWALNSNLYLIGGVGNSSFADEDHFTYNFGVGARVLPVDWFSVRLDVRDYIFEHELFGELQTTHNLSAQLGLSIYF